MRKNEAYWEKNAPQALYEGLLKSGIVNKAQPHIPTKSKPELPKNQSRPSSVQLPRLKSQNTSRDEEKHKKDDENQNLPLQQFRFSSTVSLQPKYKPPTIEEIAGNYQRSLPTITEILENHEESEKTGTISRKESQGLLNQLIEAINQCESSYAPLDSAPDKFAKTITNFSRIIILWNSFTLQLKSYNVDLSLISQKIKNFVQNIIGNFPEMVKQFQNEDTEKNQVINELRSTKMSLTAVLDKNEQEKSSLLQETRQLKVQLKEKVKEIDDLNESLAESIYKAEQFSNKYEDNQLRINRLEEQKNTLKAQVEQNSRIINDQMLQIQMQERLIEKYKEEGASFLPKYSAEKEENERLKQKIIQLSTENSVLPQNIEVGTDPIEELNEERIAQNKKSKKSKDILKRMTSKQSLLKIKDSVADIKSVRSMEIILKQAPKEISIEQTIKPDDSAQQSLIVPEPVSEAPIPEPSSVEALRIAPTMRSLVDKLLSTSLQPSISETSSQFLVGQIQKHDNDIKPFQWTLRQVFHIFKHGFEHDSSSLEKVTFMDIVRKIFIDSGKNGKILDRFQIDFLQSLYVHRNSSEAIRFFLSFVGTERSVVEFRFFCIVFNICADSVTPSLSSFLDDPDITFERDSLFIHIDAVATILKELLRINRIPPETEEILIQSTKNPTQKGFISLWSFCDSSIELFRYTHKVFQVQIRNVLLFSGWSDTDPISMTRFYEFIRITLPSSTSQEIKVLWEKLQFLKKGSKDIHIEDLLKYCSDNSEISEAIFLIPKLENYRKLHSSLSEPILNLFYFLRKRYTDYLPMFLKCVSYDSRVYISPYTQKIRDAFMRCDISTSMVCYTHILQYIDLKTTEAVPFSIYSNQTTQEDSVHSINYLKMREYLAAIHLSDISNDWDPESILNQEKDLIKKTNLNVNNLL